MSLLRIRGPWCWFSQELVVERVFLLWASSSSRFILVQTWPRMEAEERFPWTRGAPRLVRPSFPLIQADILLLIRVRFQTRSSGPFTVSQLFVVFDITEHLIYRPKLQYESWSVESCCDWMRCSGLPDSLMEVLVSIWGGGGKFM